VLYLLNTKIVYQTIQYIKFLFKATNQHGVHSPFVYNLVTKCFYDKRIYSDYKTISNYKKTLLKNSGTTIKRAKLLYRITNYFKPKNILELSSSLDITTQVIILANPITNITTIKGCLNISESTKNNFKNNKLENINVNTRNFNNEINKLKDNTYDLIFFDGNHQKEAILSYFESLLETANNETIFIFDDIYRSKDIREAWETIKQHAKVTITIDTFFWGFVFFRKEQVKEHFKIRV